MIGVVVIGRNEGPRLTACLRSVLADGVPAACVVYVDSGSTDNSPRDAAALGVAVVALDASKPFTAARGRNAGAERLATEDAVAFIQFIDGDCDLAANWLTTAEQTLSARPDVAAVCGRRRERHPQASPYNRLCDMEWNTPVGEAGDFGGDVMVRRDALRAAGGYNPDVIAAEDTELCARLRAAGWKTVRLDADMTVHDAAIFSLGQWWRRMVRAGHGFAENAALHGRSPSRHRVREVRSNWAWGLALPVTAIACAWPTRGVSVGVAALAYTLLWAKIRRSSARRGMPADDATLYARFATLAKFPMVLGQIKYWFNRLRGRRTAIIEYKKPTTPIAGALV